MAAGTGQSGFGSTLFYGDANPPTTQLAEVRDFDLPEESAGDLDVTHHTSPGGMHEKIADLLDGGKLNCELIYVEAEFIALSAIFRTRARKYWKWAVPGGANAIWQGHICKLKPNAPMQGEPMTLSLGVTVGTLPTIAAS